MVELSPVAAGAAGPGRTGLVDIKCSGCQAPPRTCSCDDAETREQAMALAEGWKHRNSPIAIALRGEIKAYEVGVDVYHAARRGRDIATQILSQKGKAHAPRLRFLKSTAADDLECDGMHFKGLLGIWIRENVTPERAFEAAAHETFHALRPGSDEKDATHFGRILKLIQNEYDNVLVGQPKETEPPHDAPPGVWSKTLLVDPDLVAYRRVSGEWVPHYLLATEECA